ncbi:MAG: DUF533 domain-containing protein [Moorea sp. SIOASIH]|uniref:DUF533 domain-containing protein n=1 Tax=Moorena sp. SIOASIH TaxID=2607817 RepID=UPI0013B9B732|nr:DUF533 domain-containing protein [Moorena sp. SIOASIH]NEO36054.1 DUF533 domain-containing protein [Moorena sp. SIOASIH]NEO89941.1 DUF533 domain-containing protein [Moorena sp. SIO3G5]
MATVTPEIDPVREIIAKWYFKELWDWDLGEIPTVEVLSTFLKSNLVAANGDGEISEEERKWIIGKGAAAGAPESLLKELESYPANEDITEVVTRTPATNKSRKASIYFAVKAAASDGEYNEGEKATIRKMAQAMDVSEEVVKEIEDLCLEEKRLKEKRIAICYSEGDPFS